MLNNYYIYRLLNRISEFVGKEGHRKVALFFFVLLKVFLYLKQTNRYE